MKRILEGRESEGAAQRTCSIVELRCLKTKNKMQCIQAVENAGWRSVYQVFCKFTCVCTCIRISKNPGPREVLNFIKIHCKIYKKLSLSRNPNPYLVIPKYCKIRHLNFSPVNEENWRKEHCLNQRYILV